MIEFNNVSYAYPFADEPAVSKISFSMAKGRAMVCTGASGSGKSTLIRLINGLAPHFHKGRLSGRVRVNGQDTKDLGIKGLSKIVGTMFQDPESQFFALRVSDELKFALECRGTPAQQIDSIITREAEKFGISHLMDNMVFDLSQGEKQKVALAGIMCISPRIIILDEPSANLDPLATQALARHLLALKQQGITLFIVDHRLYWLRDLVDQVLVLDHGQIVCKGGFDILDNNNGPGQQYGLRQTRVDTPDLPDATTFPTGQKQGDPRSAWKA